MCEVKTHLSPYSKILNILSRCPSFENLYYNKWIKYIEI